MVPDPKAEIASASEPRNAAVIVVVDAVVTATASSYTPVALTRRHAPSVSPAAGVAATLRSTPTSTDTTHCTSAAPASTSAASKSHALSYAGTRFVTPRTTTSTAGTDPRALNAGKSTRYTPSSIATVALCPVSAHCPSHGHSPMSKKGARYDCRVRHVPDVSNDRFKSARAPCTVAPPRRP